MYEVKDTLGTVVLYRVWLFSVSVLKRSNTRKTKIPVSRERIIKCSTFLVWVLIPGSWTVTKVWIWATGCAEFDKCLHIKSVILFTALTAEALSKSVPPPPRLRYNRILHGQLWQYWALLLKVRLGIWVCQNVLSQHFICSSYSWAVPWQAAGSTESLHFCNL